MNDEEIGAAVEELCEMHDSAIVADCSSSTSPPCREMANAIAMRDSLPKHISRLPNPYTKDKRGALAKMKRFKIFSKRFRFIASMGEEQK